MWIPCVGGACIMSTLDEFTSVRTDVRSRRL